jgi:hypothetical protein
MQKDKKESESEKRSKMKPAFRQKKMKPANLILNLCSPVLSNEKALPSGTQRRQQHIHLETEHMAGARREGEQEGHRDLKAALRKGRERLDRRRACEKVGSGEARTSSYCALFLRRSRASAMLRCPLPPDKLVVVTPEMDRSSPSYKGYEPTERQLRSARGVSAATGHTSWDETK